MYKKFRSTAYIFSQIVGWLVLIWMGMHFYSQLNANLARLDIRFDMGFLFHESGFNIAQKWLVHYRHSTNLNVLLTGLINTLVVSSLGILLSTILAVLLALIGRSSNPLLRATSLSLISVFRNVLRSWKKR